MGASLTNCGRAPTTLSTFTVANPSGHRPGPGHRVSPRSGPGRHSRLGALRRELRRDLRRDLPRGPPLTDRKPRTWTIRPGTAEDGDALRELFAVVFGVE